MNMNEMLLSFSGKDSDWNSFEKIRPSQVKKPLRSLELNVDGRTIKPFIPKGCSATFDAFVTVTIDSSGEENTVWKMVANCDNNETYYTYVDKVYNINVTTQAI